MQKPCVAFVGTFSLFFIIEIDSTCFSWDGQVEAYVFGGYWEDMKNIQAFYQANMQSTKKADMGYKSVTFYTYRLGKAEWK